MISSKQFEEIVDHFVRSAPQILWIENLTDDCHEAGSEWQRDKYLEFNQHEAFPGSFDAMLAPEKGGFSGGDGPCFRAVCHSAKKPNASGMRSFFSLTSSHALMEGADLVQIMRGKTADHSVEQAGNKQAQLLQRIGASLMAPISALIHLTWAHLHKSDNQQFCFRSLSLNSADFRRAAKKDGISQRALMFALVLYHFTRPNQPAGKRKRQMMAYSSLRDHGIADERDDYLQLKMHILMLKATDNFVSYAQLVDKMLKEQADQGNFNQHMYNKTLAVQRFLYPLFPRLYSRRFFEFVPYDIVLSTLPPVRPKGVLKSLRKVPIYGGSATGRGRNCIFVPGKEFLTFNFWAEQGFYHALPGLMEQLKELGVECEMPGGG